MERVEKNVVIAGEKVSRQIDPFDRSSGVMADEHVDQGEADRNAFARIEHAGEEGIAVVVVVVSIANKDEFAGEKVSHDGHTLPAGRGAAKTAGQFGAPSGEAQPVRGWLEAAEHGGSQKPAGLLEIGTVVEGAAQVFEAFEGLVLHHFVQNIARVERGHGIVATGEVAQVLKVAGAFLRELCFDQPHGLLVVVGEQADQSCFLRMHALA